MPGRHGLTNTYLLSLLQKSVMETHQEKDCKAKGAAKQDPSIPTVLKVSLLMEVYI